MPSSTRKIFFSAFLVILVALAPVATRAADFKREVVYQIITDRFFDGSTANNNPPQSAGLYAISLGLSRNFADDHEMLKLGMVMYDALYAWCQANP